MGGFFGVASKEDCMFDLFSGLTIILIWEPDGPEWLSMIGKRDLTGLFTIYKTLISEPSSIRIFQKCTAPWESAVSQTTNPSR